MDAPSTLSDENVPDRVGRYELLLPIASGGMATVYLARTVGPSGFTTEVALKLTHAHLRASAELANSLVEEGKLAARIRHRNVVSVIDVGNDPKGLYLVMEYVEGDTLANLVRNAALPTPMGVRLLLDGLAGLHAAHELRDNGGALVGVVHRDFTPQNILVGTDGMARLADFGIAKAATRGSYTREGIVKGKIGYMAPEQAQGRPLDRRCDVWAAGVVAWEIFAGRRLYADDDDLATMLKVATARPPLLRAIAPEIPEAVEAAVAGALVMSPDARYPTAAAFAKALATACRDTVGIAEVDEVATWMAAHVGPKLSRQREQIHAAPAPADRRTRPEQAAPLFESLSGTVLLPTVHKEPFTDGVSVVGGRWRTVRSMPIAPRIAVMGLLFALVIVSIASWRASARPEQVQEQARAASTAPPASVPSTASTASPASTVVDLVGLRQKPTLSIDAVGADGRRAAVAVPVHVKDVGPAPASGGPSRVRPAAARPKVGAPPLAPSPYN